jgi:hypothetical protein
MMRLIAHYLYKIAYVLSRILPILLIHYLSANIYHSFILTAVAEFFMSLDDIDLISYHTSKILGGTIFAIEKLLSYSSYLLLQHPIIWFITFIISFGLYRWYPDTEITNILYMGIVVIWCISCVTIGTPLQILGTLIYAITDYDVAMYDSQNFGILLLPTYQVGLFLLAIG